MTTASLEKYSDPTPPPIDALVAAADAEGHGFVRRTVEEWASGANRFDAPNEVWFLVELDGLVTGMCGVNIDPHLDDPPTGDVTRPMYGSDQRRWLANQATHNPLELKFTSLLPWLTLTVRCSSRSPNCLRFDLGFELH